MTFNFKKETELITTSVDYRVVEYDATSPNHARGSLARIGDDVYSVDLVRKPYPELQYDDAYVEGDKVWSDNKLYTRTSLQTNYLEYSNTYYPHDGCADNESGLIYTEIEVYSLSVNKAYGRCCESRYGEYDFEIKEDVSGGNGLREYVFTGFTYDWDNDYSCSSSKTNPIANSFSIMVHDTRETAGEGEYYRNGLHIVKVIKDTRNIASNTNLWTYEMTYNPNALYVNSIDDGRCYGPDNSCWAYDYLISDYGNSIKQNPFNDKQYLSVIEPGDQTWSVVSREAFNSVSIGRLRGASVTVTFYDENDQQVGEPETKTIDGTVDDDGGVAGIVPVTMNFRADSLIPANGGCDITISGSETEVGMIFCSYAFETGITKLEMGHEVIPNSRRRKSDVSGYEEIIRGNVVFEHTGSFWIPIQQYDKMTKLMKLLQDNTVCVNGSDIQKGDIPDSVNWFESTVMIAIVDKLKVSTTASDGNLDDMQVVDFTLLEIV